MEEIDNFDKVYQWLFQFLRQKPLEYYFSKLPEQLADDIIKELNHPDRIEPFYSALVINLAKHIRSVKMNNQLPLFKIPQDTIPFSDVLLEELQRNYPRAFEKKHKQTKKRYGLKQIKIQFPDRQPPSFFEIYS